jgi:hypothetical protein
LQNSTIQSARRNWSSSDGKQFLLCCNSDLVLILCLGE